MVIFGSYLDSLLRHACSSTMHWGTARYQPPPGELPSNQSSSGIHESGFKLSTLLCMILLLQCAAQNSPFFVCSLGKVLFLLFLCVTFSWTSQNLLLLCWDNLNKWKLYSKDGKEHCWLWDKNLSCFFFFPPVNPNIYHFSFLSLLFMSTELVSSLISKVWVRIFLSATD